MVRLRMVRLRMVPNRGVPVVAVHIGERHRGGSERGYEEDSKSFLENEFHVNPGGSWGMSDRRAMQCLESLRCKYILTYHLFRIGEPLCSMRG
jgi:hypothetical protein